jgi:hypothetical protein
MNAVKDYGKLIPKKIVRSDGKEVTYWVSPDQATVGKKDSLFQFDEPKKIEHDTGYFDQLDRNIETYQIKPLIEKINEFDTVLANRIQAKYKNYQWDRDTKEIDIEMDYETAWYLQLIRKHPDKAEEYQKEYYQKTDRNIQMINNRKRAMAKIGKGSHVRLIDKQEGVVAGFTRRGFPIVQTGKEKRPIFYEECVLP